MMPVFFQSGNLQLTSYVALIALAGIVTLFYFKRFESRLGLARGEDFWFLMNVIGLSGFLGGRLFHIFAAPEAIPDFRSFAAVLLSNQTGLSTFGALLGVWAGTYYGCRSLKLNFLQVLDQVCLVIPVGHAIARLGCFLTGCCYGHPTEGSPAWSVVFTDPAAALPPALLGVPLHATQLYEAAGDLLLGGLLYYLVWPSVGRGRFGAGLVCAAYFAGYGLLRFGLEFFRGQPELGPGTVLPLAQLFSLLMISVAVVFLLLAAKVRPAAGQKATVH